ncbi:TPA: hypothetical protein ACNOIA_004605 [Enterobacter cloacae]
MVPLKKKDPDGSVMLQNKQGQFSFGTPSLDTILASRIFFIGESIHGIAEFSQFKKEFIKHINGQNWIVLFEADALGMKLSQLRGDTEEQFLDNFPRIMQTFQTRELIALAQKQGFPCLGIDVIPRRSDADFPQDWKADRSSFIHHFITARESDNWLSWRSAKMAQNIRDIACHNPSSQLLVFLHNMHIKRDGRSERSELRLMSAREHLDKDFAGQMYSIAQFARAGRACHNDLTAFDFEINDPQSIETLIDQQSSGWRLFKCEKLVQMKVAYHHAFERETIDIRRQYEYVVLYGRVTPPEFIKK